MYYLLYVDDEPALLEICRLFLEKDGEFSVTTAQSGTEALSLLAKNRFDAVISDFQMPGMDGIELLKTIRGSYGRIPFILFTGRGREEVAISAINNGVDFYLQKGGNPKVQFVELAHKLRQSIGRMQAEKALRDSEKRLADIINFLPDATFAIDISGKVIAWNRAMEGMTGFPATGLIGRGDHEYAIAFYGKPRPMLIDLVFAPDPEFEKTHYNYTRHDPTNLTAETVIEREGKPRIYLWGKASALFDETGTVVGAIESVRDITDMKTAETELRAANEQLMASGEELKVQYDELAVQGRQARESEEKYRELVENASTIILKWDQNGKITFFNEFAQQFFGYTSKEILGKPVIGTIVPATESGSERDLAVMIREIIRSPENFTHNENENVKKTGERVWIQWRNKPLFDEKGEFLGLLSIGTDITGQKKSASALTESEEKYRTLVEHSQDGIFITQDGHLVFYNRGFREILGYPEGELDNVPITKCLAPKDQELVLARHYARIKGDRLPEVYECSFLTREGSERKVKMDVGLATYRGRPATIGTIHDITEERKKEEELQRSEEKYRTLVEHSQDVIYRTDTGGRLIMVSPSGAALLGYDSPQDLLGKSIEDDLYFSPKKRQEFLEVLAGTGMVKNYEITLRHRNGSPVIISTSCHYYHDKDGSVLGIEGILHDITRLKQKETELRQAYEQIAAAEEELRSQYDELMRKGDALQQERDFSNGVLDSVPGLLYLYDENGLLVRWNKNHETATGYTHEELAGMHLMDWYRGDEKTSALIKDRVKTALETGFADAEAELTAKDGRKIWYYFTAVRLEIEGKKYFTGIGTDISERKMAEQKTLESRRQLDEISATIPGVVYQFYARQDGSRGISYYGGRAQEIFGAPSGVTDFLAWHTAHVHPDDRQPLLDSINAALAKNGPWHFEGRFIRPSGEMIWFEGTASPVRHGNEQVYSGVLMDITERRQMEEALRESEARYRLLVENSHDIIYMISPEGILTFVSPGWTMRLGHKTGDVVGKSFKKFVHPDDIPGCEAFIARLVATNLPQSSGNYRIFHADGSIRIHQSTIAPVTGDDGRAVSYVGCATDITDLNQAQAALRESNKKLNLLSSITRHDVINQLTVIRGYIQLALLKKPDPAIADFLVKINAAMEAIQNQIEFTRTYQDLGIKAPAWHRLDDLVTAARPQSIPATCSCEGIEIFADPMISRVFFNLFENAVRHGKTVTQIRVQCEQEKNMLRITVEDDGEGIPPEEKQKIFEKGYGKHTGFGLFLAREILAITGITIHETGVLGKGARFELIVPKEGFRLP